MTENNSENLNYQSQNSNGDVIDDFYLDFYGDDDEDIEHSKKQLVLDKEIEKETTEFANIIFSDIFLKNKYSNYNFWIKHKKTLPFLSKFARKFMCISSSSSFIERFFSICGVISNKRNLNMNTDLFITRSILKANMKIVKEISFNYENDE